MMYVCPVWRAKYSELTFQWHPSSQSVMRERERERERER